MIGVIPAGGRADRFGGIYKELLPIGEREYLFDRSIRRAIALGADKILVISNAQKIIAHTHFIERHMPDLDITVVARREQDEALWQGLRSALRYHQECIMVLPDTVFTVVQPIPVPCDFAFGTFMTQEPERYSVIGPRNIIQTKQALTGHESWAAWGCVYWSHKVSAYWQDREAVVPYASYDQAFQDAIDTFGLRMFDIDEYHDLGSWEHYQEYICRKG